MPQTHARKHPPGRPLEGSHLCAELIHAHQALEYLFSREVGITPTRLKLFHELMHAGSEGVGLGDLALRLDVTPALVTRRVAELETDGWVRRRTDARDGRRSIVRLTARGRNEILKFHERAHRFEDVLTAELPPEETAAAVRVLAHLGEKIGSWRKSGRYLLEAEPVGGRD